MTDADKIIGRGLLRERGAPLHASANIPSARYLVPLFAYNGVLFTARGRLPRESIIAAGTYIAGTNLTKIYLASKTGIIILH